MGKINFLIILLYSCETFLEKYKIKCRNFGKDNKLLLFDILDYLVDQGSMNIWKAVSSKKFFSFLLDILKTQNDAEIQTKLLNLIQNWGNSFQNKKDVVPNFYKIYNKFLMNGVVFPPKEQPNYYNFISKKNPNPPTYKKENLEEKKNIKENFEEENDFEENNDTNNDFEYMESIKDNLKISNYESKYRRLVAFLVNMHNNIKSANILIDKKEISKLKDPINTIRKGKKTLMDTISSGRLKDDKLMDITLATNEDINQTLEREEELKVGNKPNKFTSSFVLNEIIPLKNKKKMRAKSERKKGTLSKRNNFEKQNKNETIVPNNNIKNVNDIFDLFSNSNTNTNINSNISNNNNQENNMISNYYTNKNPNNNFFDINQVDDMQNYNNNDFNNYNTNNENKMNQMNKQNNSFNRSRVNNKNFNKNNPRNKMIDLFQDNRNNKQRNNNFQNQNFNKPNEFDMYGPAPELNSNELVNYIGPFNTNNNNNQFQNNNQNNNYNYEMNPNSGNNFGNDMGNNYKMTQEEIEREQRLKELDELF